MDRHVRPRHRPGRLYAAAALVCALTGCVGPIGRIGFDRDVVATLAQDEAAWCITVDMATFVLGVAVVRVSYWRDNAADRPASRMRDCSGP